ncbi:MAG: diadenylate cyclase CdaA [Dehalococcoidia bacterium]|nr:diadenylate cyclase CdaA [Dehalococcoidia bacterium]HRC61959.1 diadenylate cyclase CdaA [Dehalococcoidia bacterium]
MPDFSGAFGDAADRLTPSAVIDILIVSVSVYWLLLLIRGTTAMTVLRGAVVLLGGAFLLSRALDLLVVNWLLRNSVTGIVIAMAIVFQPEIRRALERLGRTGLRSSLRREERLHTVDTVVRAASRLARQGRGALIVLERETGLQEVIDTGVPLGADLSAELLGTIFVANSPLHDGAAIIRLDRVVAAGCTLPLSETPLPAEYGMRHRAALGITERTDAVVVVVSEERGEVSLASNGRMLPDLDEVRLGRQLYRLFDLDGLGPEPLRLEGSGDNPERQAS